MVRIKAVITINPDCVRIFKYQTKDIKVKNIKIMHKELKGKELVLKELKGKYNYNN